MKHTVLHRLRLFILPLLFLWGGLSMQLAKFGNDPNYVYLVNATAICNGEWVGYTDHPGTPVMQIGAIVIAVKHFFYNSENQRLTEHVFSDPHSFIESICTVFIFLNSFILLLLGRFAFIKTKSIWVAFLLQITTFITANTFDHAWTKVSPEPLLFFLSCLFVILILKFYYSSNKYSWKYVLIFAAICGAGLATKATFFPLVFFPLIAIPSTKKKIVFILTVPIVFLLCTIPIIPEYKNMYYWFRGLSSHSGIYGHGEKGFIDFRTYLPSVLAIARNNAIFVMVTTFSMGLIVFQSIKVRFKLKALSLEFKILAALSISSLFGILMVAKHYHSNHYLIPVLLLSGIQLLFIHKVLVKNQQRKFPNLSLPLTVVLLFIFVGFKIPQKLNYANEGYKSTNQEMLETNARIEEEYKDYTKVYYYPNAFYPYSGLNFGDVYCQRRMLPELKRVHGDIYFFHSNEKTVKNWNQAISVEQLIEKKGNKILLVGGPFNNVDAHDLWQYGFPVKEIYDGRIQAIYELDTIRHATFLKENTKDIKWVNNISFDRFNSQNSVIDSYGKPLGNVNNLSKEQARSGTYSIKFDSNTEYAVEYHLQNLIAGEKYQIEVWRKSNSADTRLVIAANDSDKFYKANFNTFTKDDSGWELIQIHFTVPEILNGERVKIYLWNPSKKESFMDDLSIIKFK